MPVPDGRCCKVRVCGGSQSGIQGVGGHLFQRRNKPPHAKPRLFWSGVSGVGRIFPLLEKSPAGYVVRPSATVRVQFDNKEI